MNLIPEQFSAARQVQLDNGFNLMRSFSDQALDRTSRVVALQLNASRAAVEQSTNAMRQLLAARDPRDLLELGTQSQQHLRTMFDYGRELMSIASAGMSLPMFGTPAAMPVQAAVQAGVQETAHAVERTVAEIRAAAPAAPRADFTQPLEAQAVAPVADSSATEASIVSSNIAPDSAPTAMAKATSEALDLRVAPPHPVAASMPVEVAVEIELPKVEPVDATPPPAAVTGRPADTRGTKGRRKQH